MQKRDGFRWRRNPVDSFERSKVEKGTMTRHILNARLFRMRPKNMTLIK